MLNKKTINNIKDEEYGMSSELLAAVLKEINEKLDKVMEEINSIKSDNKDVKTELDKHDIRIKSLESEKEKPIKTKILDQVLSGLSYSFGAFILFLVVMVVLKSFGVSAGGILKAFFVTLGA